MVPREFVIMMLWLTSFVKSHSGVLKKQCVCPEDHSRPGDVYVTLIFSLAVRPTSLCWLAVLPMRPSYISVSLAGVATAVTGELTKD